MSRQFDVDYQWRRSGCEFKVTHRYPSQEEGVRAVVVVECTPVFGNSTNYEVAKIRWSEARFMGGKEIPAGERYPSSEEWGVSGWTYNKAGDAHKKANLIVVGGGK